MDEHTIATESRLAAFENAFGAIPTDYREFLSTTGIRVIREMHLGGIHDLARYQTRYQKEFGPPAGWSMENVFIIGWTAASEPLAIHRRSGAILVERGPGSVEILAESFRCYLQQRASS